MALNFLNNGYFAGKVGIGTEGAVYQLTLGGNAVGSTEGLRINDPSNAAYGAHFSFSDTPNEVWIGGITNNTYNSAIGIYREATRSITIDASNEVGIGVTGPNAKLHVLGNVILDSHSVSDPDSNSRNAYPAAQMFTHYTEANGVSIIGGAGGYSGASLTIGEETGRSSAFKFIRGVSDTNGGASAGEEFWVNGIGGAYFAGDVGIGTTNPSTRLEVAASATTSVDIAHFSNSNDVVKIKHALDGLGSGITSIFDASNNEDIRLSAQSNSWFNAGNVGIGNSDPQANLVISNAAGGTGGVNLEIQPISTAVVQSYINRSASPAVYIKNEQRALTHEWDINLTTKLTLNSTGLIAANNIDASSYSGPGEGLDNLLPLGVYSTTPGTQGILIKTNIVSNNYAFIFGTINLEQFNFTSVQRIQLSATVASNGTVVTKAATSDIAITMKLFHTGGYWYIHLPTASTYVTASAYIYTGAGYQGQAKGFNEVNTISVNPVPSGATSSVDIVADVYVTTGSAGGSGPFLPLTGGTLSGPGNLTVGGTTNLSSTLTVGADADGHDVLFYGNATGEKMIWDHNNSRLTINHDTNDSGFDVFTVSSASMTQPQLRVGRDVNQFWGVYTDDRNAQLVHRQDETTGTMKTLFDQWDSNTSDATGEWAWRSGNGSGGSMATALELKQSGDATFAGDVLAPRFDIGTDSTSIIQETDRMKLTNSIADDAGGFDFYTRKTDSAYVNALQILGTGDSTFAAQAFSAATSSGDGSSTLTTKGYVDGLITGATIYRGTWNPDKTQNSGYGVPDLSGVTQTSGYYYICSAVGIAEPNGSGCEPDSWAVGDWVIWNDDVPDCAGTGTGAWQKIDNTSVLSGIGTGSTVALWEGASSVPDSETLGNAPITVSGNDTTFAGLVSVNNKFKIANNGTATWGAANDYGQLSWDTGYALIRGQSNRGIKLQTNSSTTALTLDTSQNATFAGNVGIRTAPSSAPLHVVTTSDLSDALVLEFAGTYQGGPYQTFQYNEGGSSPSENGDLIGGIRARTAYASGTYAGYSTAIEFRNDGSPTSTSTPGGITFLTTAVNATTVSQRMRINNAGAIQFNAYGAGTLVTDASGNITASSGGGEGGPYLPLSAGPSYPLTGDLHIAKNAPYLILERTGGSNVDPSGTIVFKENNASEHFKINYNGANDRLEFQGLISTTITDLVYINRDTTTPLNVLGGAYFAGNVGIGITGASEKLHVNGNIEMANNSWIGSTDGAYWQRIRFEDSVPDTTNAFNFETRNGSGVFVNHMTILNNGNVGIGAVSPANGKLVIDSTTNQIAIETGTAGDGRLNIGHFSNGTFIGTYGDDGGAADLIRFGTHSGDERMRITSAGNVGINSTNPPSLLDVQPTSANRKVTRIANDVMSTYFYNTQADAVLAWTCGSYYQAEVVITANQTNGGTTANLYIRGIWSNNHTSHHWDELEHIGSLPGSTITMSVGQNGSTTASGRLELDFDYISGSFSQLNVRVTDFYGSHSYTIT